MGTGFAATPLVGTVFGFDFNPTIDRIRVVSEADQNRVVNPNTGGLAVTGTPVAFRSGDPNFGIDPNLAHHAYDNNTFGPIFPLTSQLYAIDVQLNALVRQANNAGTLDTVGSLGIDVPNRGLGGFDIAEGGTAFAAFHDGVSTTSSLYRIDLATGAATNIGSFAGSVRGLSATVPEPGSFALLGMAIAECIARRRRRN